MTHTKHQIFVSSTYEDLKEQREAVVKAILEIGDLPVGMEMFSAGDADQWTLIKQQIDQSDFYVVLSARRYGSMFQDISYTEREYDYAISKGIPVLGFLLKQDAPWPNDAVHFDPKNQARLSAFQMKIRSRMVSFWSTSEEVGGKVVIALMKQKNLTPRPGWVRADQVPSPDIVTEVARLTQEVARLSEENGVLRERASAESIFSLIDSMSDGPESQAVIYMHETKKDLPTYARYVYGYRDHAQGSGTLGGFNRNSLVNAGIIRAVSGGQFWTLTSEGKKFADWLIAKGRKCSFFYTEQGGWGPIPKDAEKWADDLKLPPQYIEVPNSDETLTDDSRPERGNE